MQGDCEFDNPKARGKVTACLRDAVREILPDLFREHLELFDIQGLQIRRTVDS
jgi:hypothetical protein